MERGGFGGGVVGSYNNETSDMGHLIDDEANKIMATIDPSRFNSGPAVPTLRGRT